MYFAETLKLEERLLDMIEELKIEDWVVVNPLGEMVKELAGFELGDHLEGVAEDEDVGAGWI